MEIVIEWLGAAKDILFQWLGWVLAGLLVLTAAVKGTVRFDINEWLKERRKHMSMAKEIVSVFILLLSFSCAPSNLVR